MRAAAIQEEHLINGRVAQESFFGSTVGEKAAPGQPQFRRHKKRGTEL